MIYEFRYRSARSIVETKHLEAPDFAAAIAGARAWVTKQPQATFIESSVAPWLIAPPVVDGLTPTATEPVPLPSLTEQRRRQAAAVPPLSVGDPQRSVGRIGG